MATDGRGRRRDECVGGIAVAVIVAAYHPPRRMRPDRPARVPSWRDANHATHLPPATRLMTTDVAEDPRGTTSTPSAPRIGRWSFGILVVATLRIIDAVSMAAIGLGVQDLPVDALPIVLNSPDVTRGVDLILAAATLLGVVGLLAFRRWGWVLTMVIVGFGLFVELVRVARGQPDHLGLLLLVVSAFYLNQRSVRAMAARHLEHGARRTSDG